MDPIDRAPEGYGQDGDGGSTPGRRPPRDSLAADFQSAPVPVRTVRLVAGDLLLTLNPVDGSEIEPCPPTERPGPPARFSVEERARNERAARPPVPPGPALPALPLLARQDERESLVRLLARGRTVRLTGPSGSGRSALLDLVAEDCADLAPDGVVRLSGFGRTADELLHDLFHAVHDAPRYRPQRDELRALVREIGAVVVVDDIGFGGAAFDELIDATPECAFLVAAIPQVPAPSDGSGVEEVVLAGLDRAAGVDLLEHAIGRVLTEDEVTWAGDLWFESEGLPLRFVQAGALLRQRDQLRASAGAVDVVGVFEDVRLPGDAEVDADVDPVDPGEVPLPSLGEAAAPAPLLASRLSASARATLRFAVALDGEVPHQAHLPALVGDTHADAALGELAACGLVSPVGSRYRLAAGVRAQLTAAGYGDDVPGAALAAARHYAWWTGHPSVTPERVCAEADAVLAALGVLVPDTAPAAAAAAANDAVLLAHSAGPAFAAGLRWSAWERTLRFGAEASRLAGDVSEQAYFQHESGVIALCEGQLDRARRELEAAVALRGALADKRGGVTGRRALALVTDRAGDGPGVAVAGEELSEARHEQPALAPGRVLPALPAGGGNDTVVTSRTPAPKSRGGGVRRPARRNLVAAGAGTLLAAVLGTVVTLGMTSHDSADDPSGNVGVNPSVGQGDPGVDPAEGAGSAADPGTATGRPTDPGHSGKPGATDDPTSPTDGRPAEPAGAKGPEGGSPSTPPRPTTSRPTSRPTTPKPSTSSSGSTPTGNPSGSASPSPSGSTSSSPSAPDTASRPA
ncbi:ATP-binding protein [Streptomyces sp. NPDC086787]|uniref:ATP-binding protein n=1 Tax=Streptomyces sp. NPDC086787 TaxID=3365759 RepID=UPI0037FE1285